MFVILGQITSAWKVEIMSDGNESVFDASDYEDRDIELDSGSEMSLDESENCGAFKDRSRSPTRRRSRSSTRSHASRDRSRSGRRSRSVDSDPSNKLRKWRQSSYDDKDHSWYPSYPALACRSPFEYFQEYFDDEFFQTCAECTNLYYKRKHRGNELNTTAAEIKNLFGVLLVMGCISYPRTHMYWRQKMQLLLISNVMSRDRFCLLREHIQIVPTDKAPSVNKTALWKVQPAIDAVRNACRKLKRIPSFYSVHEHMIRLTEKSHNNPCSKSKPIGLKNYIVTTGEGLIVNFEINCSKSPKLDRSIGEGPGVVLCLAQDIPRGSCIYFNKYFNTIPLLDRLSEMGLHGTGTIGANRVPNGKELNLSEKEGMKSGDIQQYVSGEVALVKWVDTRNKAVLIASNCTGGDNVKTVQKFNNKGKELIPVKAPQVVMNYNKNMGGVDILHQAFEYNKTVQRTKKWTVKVLSHLLDLAVANAWRQYRLDRQGQGQSSRKDKDLLWFRLDVADCLTNCPERERREEASDTADNALLTLGKYKQTAPPSVGKRYDGYDHLPIFDDSLQSPRACRLEQCNSRTKIICSKCDVYICLSRANNCFYAYHKKEVNDKYKTIK
ncbi:piggyBac transposable element-derived protein 3-like isoform X1 [Cydia pomonella]|uniref:piggyBac transposable element-derived protein 3-like isoform X1 n=1 Tax=Cydia pomonella TaxID=82600 RepID=UPI002ADE67E6|nr:piggyBac transposable element-derived protein 3-like isoform X1 [Cydia pomonella]XP_061704418.1 piggyBac transposable element-derived protein 3-like isoform X1 [Cydia pomonella]